MRISCFLYDRVIGNCRELIANPGVLHLKMCSRNFANIETNPDITHFDPRGWKVLRSPRLMDALLTQQVD